MRNLRLLKIDNNNIYFRIKNQKSYQKSFLLFFSDKSLFFVQKYFKDDDSLYCLIRYILFHSILFHISKDLISIIYFSIRDYYYRNKKILSIILSIIILYIIILFIYICI